MSEQHTQEDRRVECEVPTDQQIVAFVHRLGGPVTVTAYTPEGDRVGYLMAVPITDDEVEVALVPDIVYARLVAVPATEDAEDGQ